MIRIHHFQKIDVPKFSKEECCRTYKPAASENVVPPCPVSSIVYVSIGDAELYWSQLTSLFPGSRSLQNTTSNRQISEVRVHLWLNSVYMQFSFQENLEAILTMSRGEFIVNGGQYLFRRQNYLNKASNAYNRRIIIYKPNKYDIIQPVRETED